MIELLHKYVKPFISVLVAIGGLIFYIVDYNIKQDERFTHLEVMIVQKNASDTARTLQLSQVKTELCDLKNDVSLIKQAFNKNGYTTVNER